EVGRGLDRREIGTGVAREDAGLLLARGLQAAHGLEVEVQLRGLAAELLHRLGDRLELTLRQRERLGAEEGVLIDRTSTSAPVAREAREQCVGGFDRSEETRLNSSHVKSSYAVFCLKKKTKNQNS